MKEYLLSIIIPHYNLPDMLEKLLNSIPERDDFQIVIVDDNSTKDVDKLNMLIERNGNRQLVFCRNYTGKNSAGTCRNIGLEQAKGKWIVFADSDDYFVDGWYEKLEPYFATDNEMVYFAQTSVFLDTGKVANRHTYFGAVVRDYCSNPCRENEIRLRYGAPAAWLAMYSREFLHRINARFACTMTEEDKQFIFTCGDNVSKFVCIPDEIYCLTARRDSLTATKNFEKFDLHQKVLIKRCGILYSKLTKNEIKALELENVGIQILYTTIINGYGLKQALKYRRLQKENGVPLMQSFNIISLASKLFRSIKDRIKTRINKKTIS